MLFWIIAAVLGAGVVAALWRAANLGGARLPDGAAATADIGVYRDQLAGVEADLARGVIGADEAGRLRIEISRRILAADRARGDAPVGAAGPRLAVPLVAALGVVGAVWLYDRLGVPGYPDLPLSGRIAASEAARAARPSQAAAEAATSSQAVETEQEFAKLMDALRASTVEHPDKIEGFRLLATYEARLGNFAAAARAKARVIELTEPQAVMANDYAELADLLVQAAGGTVTETADAAIAAALQLDPGNGTALFYAGLMEAQTGRPDRAFAIWRGLLEDGPQDAPWVDFLRANLTDLGQAAGVDYAPPAAPTAAPGPGAADIAAAADMSAGDREAMIRGMVEGLETRLAAEGGSADDWTKLITSLGVLGESDRARQALAQATAAFGGDTQAMAAIRAAAEAAGVAE